MEYDRYMVKAKCIETGKWVTGYYYKMAETTYCCAIGDELSIPVHHYILQETMTDWGLPNRMLQYEVDSDTLCQCTEFMDVYDNMIWENDLVKFTQNTEEYFGYIELNDEGYGFQVVNENSVLGDNIGYLSMFGDIEVIGNKFDEEK